MNESLVYEQCPWNRMHVNAIYPILNGIIIDDSDWHEFPPRDNRVGKYRVYKGDFFQAVFSERPTSLYLMASALDALQLPDDAEWEIWQKSDTFIVSDRFCFTPGPFLHQEQVVAWLDRHALHLDNNDSFVRGVALFTEFTSDCLLDAIHRLHWLEIVIAEVNDAIQETSRVIWERHKGESDTILDGLPADFSTEEIIPVPPTIGLRPKLRLPVLDEFHKSV